jgi:PAS domain S-box-containing protein
MTVKTRLSGLILPNIGLAIVFGMALGLVSAGACALGHHFFPHRAQLFTLIVVFAISAIFVKAHASMMRMHTAVSATLSAILNDQHAWRRHLDGSAPLREIGNSKLRQIIEELGEAMSSLRAERRRTETVLQQTANGIIAIDSTGKIDLFNRAASLILGQEESEVIGKRLADLDLHPEIRRLVSNCIAGGTVCEAEVKLPGVPWKVVRMRAAPLKASDGRQDSAVLILQDMTEVRRHENHQKEFVSNVSHELRTPITAVRSTAEALLGGAKNDPAVVDKFLNTIVLESERLSALIEDLMDIAKRDSGILQTRMETVSVEKVIGARREYNQPCRPGRKTST